MFIDGAVGLVFVILLLLTAMIEKSGSISTQNKNLCIEHDLFIVSGCDLSITSISKCLIIGCTCSA